MGDTKTIKQKDVCAYKKDLNDITDELELNFKDFSDDKYSFAKFLNETEDFDDLSKNKETKAIISEYAEALIQHLKKRNRLLYKKEYLCSKLKKH